MVMKKEGAVFTPSSKKPELTEKRTSPEVFYNSACPICRKGIEGYKEKFSSSTTDCPIKWTDVNSDNSAALELGCSLEYVREQLHIRDEKGKLWIGIDAFIYIWSLSPRDRWKAMIVSLPIVHFCGKVAYRIFARGLYLVNKSLRRW